MEEHLITEEPVEHVIVLRLNRPARRNALTKQLVLDLAVKLEAAASNPNVRAVIIAGDERAFCAGSDIHEMNERGFAAILDEERLSAWRSIERFSKPLIAAVRGFALGAGNELAMACDFIVSGENAQFGQPEVKIGGLAGDGGSQRLPRLIGRQAAAKMLLTGAPVSAREALALGLVAELVPDDEVLKRAVSLAEMIARNAPLSVAVTKRLIQQTDERPLSDGLRQEREALLNVFQSADRVEGMNAFAEKRPPNWSGK